VYPLTRLPLCEAGLVTVTVTVTVTAPALPAGVVAEIVVLFTTVALVAAAVPKVTIAPDAKFVPVMVTAVAPEVDPLLGDTLLTVSASGPLAGLSPTTAVCQPIAALYWKSPVYDPAPLAVSVSDHR